MFLYRIKGTLTESKTKTNASYCESQLPQGSPLSVVIRANYQTKVSIASVPLIFHTGSCVNSLSLI